MELRFTHHDNGKWTATFTYRSVALSTYYEGTADTASAAAIVAMSELKAGLEAQVAEATAIMGALFGAGAPS